MRGIRDIDLMQLADGELGADERAEVEAALAADPERARLAADKVAGIEELGEVVRGDLEIAADEAEPRLGRMWAEIEKRIELDAAPARAIPARPATVAPTGPTGLWARVGKWFDAYRGHVLTGALSAGAVAAIALVLRPAPKVASPDRTAKADLGVPSRTAVKDPGGTDVKQADPIPVAQPAGPAEIDAVEAPGGTSTVFTYATDDGEETTVIWVTPDDTTEGL